MPPRKTSGRRSGGRGGARGSAREPARSAKRRSRHLEGIHDIDARDYGLLQKFVTDHGKILPTRLTGTTAKQQRQLKRAVRRARAIGMLP